MTTREHVPFVMLNDRESGLPLYRQIYESIRAAILSGELASRTRLPATRSLAEQLGVSRITVVNAYEQLLAEGYLEGRTGAGTFVAARLPDELLQAAHARTEKKGAPLTGENRSVTNRLSAFGRRLSARDVRSVRAETISKFQPFQNGLTAVDEFPFDVWSRIAARLHQNPPLSLLSYGDPQGYLPLREAVAAHLRSARGVNCTPGQVIITAGAQQALDLTARLFLGEEDAVLIEDPCYLEAKNVFAAYGAKRIPIPVDAEGFNPASIPAEGGHAKLVYVTPSHQFPLGVTMSLARRLALLEWARQSDAWIIEDDYNSEFRYAGRPLASLQGLDPAGRVIYVGTFSKTIFPSLRIGCLVVPPDLAEMFTAARALADVNSSLIDQAILAEFIGQGHFARHVRRMRRIYEERQNILVEECGRQLQGLLEVEKAEAGMHLVGWLPAGVSDVEISRKAAAQNLKLAPISAYFTRKPARGGFVLGYTAFGEKQIKEAVAKFSVILSAEISRQPGP